MRFLILGCVALFVVACAHHGSSTDSPPDSNVDADLHPVITITATHETMEAGQAVPPLIWTASPSVVGLGCTGDLTLSTTAASSSTPGTYPISIQPGTLACPGYQLGLVGNDMQVIATDGAGAQITNGITYPPGFNSGPSANPVVNGISNSICNLDNTGQTDSTACFNSLLTQYMSGNCGERPKKHLYLYLPAGTYLVSDSLSPCGSDWSIFGQGPNSTIIRVAPNSPAFQTAKTALWNSAAVSGNQQFRMFMNGVGFDVGYGNPMCTGVVIDNSNVGSYRDVLVWAEDSNIVSAVTMQRPYPGPGLLKNVGLYGGGYGITTNQIEYNFTLDQITIEGQLTAAFLVHAMKFSIQHLLSDNQVTAFTLEGMDPHVAILDSQLLNGAPAATAITVAASGSFYARNVTVAGYGTAEVDTGTGTAVTYATMPAEVWTGGPTTVSSLFPIAGVPHSLGLPEEETPLPTDDPDQSKWTALSATPSSWCAQITGSTSATVYLPPSDQYLVPTAFSCTIPSTVNHINFYTGMTTSSTAKITLTVADNSTTPLVIDSCLYNQCNIVHTGTRPVVFNDATLGTYTPSAGAGNVYLEDIGMPAFASVAGQKIWARQLNQEQHATGVTYLFDCVGSKFWILGYKTETGAPNLSWNGSFDSGCQAEIFGAFLYPLRPAGTGTAAWYVSNSTVWIAPQFSYVNTNGNNWQYWVSETQGGTTHTLAMPSQNTGDYTLNAYESP